MESARTSHSAKAFTLLEMLIVLAIISIMLVATIPAGGGKVDQVRVAETIDLVKRYQSQIAHYYRVHNEFPANNAAADLPEPTNIVGNYMSGVYLVDGALHLQLGNKIRQELNGKLVSIRPIFVPDVPNTPVSWICGNDTVPPEMLAAGENRTSVPNASLPLSCR